MVNSENILESKLFKDSGIFWAQEAPWNAPQFLQSGNPILDHYLGGGLAFGSISEWGMPFGLGGRTLILGFLSSATTGRGLENPLQTLWISAPGNGLHVYPPAWAARGVNLARVRFTTSAKPVEQLARAFYSPTFQVIVLDSPHCLSKDDLAFLAAKIRCNRQILILLRNFFLSHRIGNIWAKLRINFRSSFGVRPKFHLQLIRGHLPPRELVLEIDYV